MGYFTAEQVDAFYRPDMENTYPFSTGGVGYVYEHPETGELAFVAYAPDLIDPSALSELASEIDWELGYANSDHLAYGFSADHCSDTGPCGWNCCAVIDVFTSLPGGYNDFIELVRVDVPYPPMDAPEYDDFPADDVRRSAMEDAIARICS